MGRTAAERLPKRLLGRTGRWVTPLALGGQASLQWTAPGIDAPDIIVRAVQLGVNYLDSANVYGPSQMNYGEAFRRMHLAPGTADYNPALRESLYVASKTRERYALGPSSASAQTPGATAVSDIKRTLTQMFGDGKGTIPEGAYLDAIQMHALGSMDDVDQLYLGMAERGRQDAAADRRLRGAARLPRRHELHRPESREPAVRAAHRDDRPPQLAGSDGDAAPRHENNLDTLLVALNANDKLYTSHEYNVLQLAVGRGMGVIAMKLFGDGSFYGKDPHFSKTTADVIYSVGKADKANYQDLVRYSLSIPGVSCAVTGIGHIDREKPENDQLVANLAAATQDPASPAERRRIEREVAGIYGATTNYFQLAQTGLVQPSVVKVEKVDGNDQVVGPLEHGDRGGQADRQLRDPQRGPAPLVGPVPPQLTPDLLWASLPASAVGSGTLTVVAKEG